MLESELPVNDSRDKIETDTNIAPVIPNTESCRLSMDSFPALNSSGKSMCPNPENPENPENPVNPVNPVNCNNASSNQGGYFLGW